MCSGGVTATIIGVDVDAAVEPILTLLNENYSAGSGVSETFLNKSYILVFYILIMSYMGHFLI